MEVHRNAAAEMSQGIQKRGRRAFWAAAFFFYFYHFYMNEKKLELEEIDAKKANRNTFCGHNSTDS